MLSQVRNHSTVSLTIALGDCGAYFNKFHDCVSGCEQTQESGDVTQKDARHFNAATFSWMKIQERYGSVFEWFTCAVNRSIPVFFGYTAH